MVSGGGPQNLDNMLSSESAQRKGTDDEQKKKKVQRRIQGQGSVQNFSHSLF